MRRKAIEENKRQVPFAFRFMLGFWLLLGFLDLLKNWVAALNAGRVFDWSISLVFILIYSFAWIFLSYPIYELFVKTRGRSWLQRVALQVPSSILFGAFHIFIVSVAFSYFIYHKQSVQTDFTGFFVIRFESRFVPSALNSAIAYWVVIIILFAFNYYEEYRKQSVLALRLESQLSQTHLQALRMQVQPHFLFNAHNTIAMLIRTGKYESAIDMISGVSDLLRTTLTRKHDQLIPLHAEMDLVRKYFAVEQARFEDTLKTVIEMSAATSTALVPNMILQPIVENAFKHGISRSLGERSICITSNRNNDKLSLAVYNSGPPLPEPWDLHQYGKIGLSNVMSRLQQLYPGEHQFVIANDRDGVEVRIEIPYREKEPAA